MVIRRIKYNNAKNLKGSTNWEELRKMSDTEVITEAKLDPLTKALSLSELIKFKREKKKKV